MFFFYSFIGTTHAAESDPPVLNTISVDKTVVDVSNGPQTVTFSFDAYDQAIKNGYPPEKVVLGMVSSQFTSETFENALEEVRKIKEKYRNFGGVFNWEYFDSPPDKKHPEIWAIEMNKVLCNQQQTVLQNNTNNKINNYLSCLLQ